MYIHKYKNYINLRKSYYREYSFFLIIIFILFNFLIGIVSSSLKPSGATPSSINNSTYTPDDPIAVPAVAGNVTEINFNGVSVTQSWQGYFGNVTGSIVLGDVNKYVMYNWSVTSPRGEIYASTNNSIQWQYIQCFNFTAAGTYDNADLGFAGQTSRYGTNLTQLEEFYNIRANAADGVDETFYLFGAPNGHRTFYTNNLKFENGECRSTRIFGPNGSQNAGEFEEVLLYEPSTRSIVFATILNENLLGFDNRLHDFQMLVLEDGHYDNIATTPYYFWVEIE